MSDSEIFEITVPVGDDLLGTGHKLGASSACDSSKPETPTSPWLSSCSKEP